MPDEMVTQSTDAERIVAIQVDEALRRAANVE